MQFVNYLCKKVIANSKISFQATVNFRSITHLNNVVDSYGIQQQHLKQKFKKNVQVRFQKFTLSAQQGSKRTLLSIVCNWKYI